MEPEAGIPTVGSEPFCQPHGWSATGKQEEQVRRFLHSAIRICEAVLLKTVARLKAGCLVSEPAYNCPLAFPSPYVAGKE